MDVGVCMCRYDVCIVDTYTYWAGLDWTGLDWTGSPLHRYVDACDMYDMYQVCIMYLCIVKYCITGRVRGVRSDENAKCENAKCEMWWVVMYYTSTTSTHTSPRIPPIEHNNT